MEQFTNGTAFLGSGGQIGILMRSHDWSSSPLGNPASWPESLSAIASLVLNSTVPMFIAWGSDLGFLYNDAYLAILRNKHPAALGRSLPDACPELAEEVGSFMRGATAGGGSYQKIRSLALCRDGREEQIWLTFSYAAIFDKQGTIAGVHCTCIEATQQVVMERQREEESQRLRLLFKKAPGLMAVLHGPTHVYELVNDAYMQVVGDRPLIGRTIREALPEIEGQGFFELLDQVYATGEPFIGRAMPVRIQRQAGKIPEERFVDFVLQPIQDHAGETSGIFIEGSDVTETVMSSKALRESEERLRQLANTIPHLAWMANPDGWIHWYNDRWYQYTGKTFEEMQGWGWQSVHYPEELPHVMEEWKRSIATGKPFELTFPLRSASGEFRPFFTRAAPLRDAAGNIIQWFGTNTEVTEIEKAHEELRASNRRKDDFLAMLAHELRNPLAPISTAAELLKLSSLDAERIRKTSAIISRQVAHMTELVDDLLDVSRVTRGLITLQRDTLDAKEIITDAIEQVHSLIELKHQNLTLEVPDIPALLRGDRMRLIQIFSNILNNAAKFTREYGHITLRMNVRPGEIEVRVQDNGIGITRTLLPHVFDLFTQAERTPDRAQGGLGLGLTLVKSLVELHGGRVSVHSEGTGRGSEFVVCLPRLADNSTYQLRSEIRSRTGAKRALRLMVVDDNVDAAETLSLLLQSMGHDVSVTHSPQQALELVRRVMPDVLFLDIGMPEMDGYELARRLRAMPELVGSVLVALTGYGQEADRERSILAGFNHHLVKPIKLDDILGLFAGL